MQIFTILNLFHIISMVYSLEVPKVTLNTGYEIPVIGIGTWQALNSEVVRSVKYALEAGYRHIDTAWFYKNEKQVGKAVHQTIKKGIIKREDVFITTKIWPTMETTEEAYDIIINSLKQMNLTYIDLMLLHWPSKSSKQLYKALEMAFDNGLVRSIGISNFDVKEMKALIKSARIMPAVNQLRIHPGVNQQKTIDYCRKIGVHVTGYSPLHTGRLINNPTLIEIGKHYNKTSAQVMIRWQIHRGLSVVPKSVHKNRIIENLDVLDFKLSFKDRHTIHNMKQLKKSDYAFWT